MRFDQILNDSKPPAIDSKNKRPNNCHQTSPTTSWLVGSVTSSCRDWTCPFQTREESRRLSCEVNKTVQTLCRTFSHSMQHNRSRLRRSLSKAFKTLLRLSFSFAIQPRSVTEQLHCPLITPQTLQKTTSRVCCGHKSTWWSESNCLERKRQSFTRQQPEYSKLQLRGTN